MSLEISLQQTHMLSCSAAEENKHQELIFLLLQ
jgi:hypothetical protein